MIYLVTPFESYHYSFNRIFHPMALQSITYMATSHLASPDPHRTHLGRHTSHRALCRDSGGANRLSWNSSSSSSDGHAAPGWRRGYHIHTYNARAPTSLLLMPVLSGQPSSSTRTTTALSTRAPLDQTTACTLSNICCIARIASRSDVHDVWRKKL